MKDLKALLAKLAKLDGGADLAKELEDAAAEAAADADSARAAEKAAAKALKAAEAARDKATTDLEAARKGETDQVAQLTAERDRAKALLDAAQAEHRAHRISGALTERLGITDPARRAAAVRLLGVPEGVELDEKGALIGADKALAEFRKVNAFLFDPPGHGGDAPGAGPSPTPPRSADPKSAALEMGKTLAGLALGPLPGQPTTAPQAPAAR